PPSRHRRRAREPPRHPSRRRASDALQRPPPTSQRATGSRTKAADAKFASPSRDLDGASRPPERWRARAQPSERGRATVASATPRDLWRSARSSSSRARKTERYKASGARYNQPMSSPRSESLLDQDKHQDDDQLDRLFRPST